MHDVRTIIELKRLTGEIAERVRSICAHLTEPELFSLASDMAIIELKYFGVASPTLVERRRAPPALVVAALVPPIAPHGMSAAPVKPARP